MDNVFGHNFGRIYIVGKYLLCLYIQHWEKFKQCIAMGQMFMFPNPVIKNSLINFTGLV